MTTGDRLRYDANTRRRLAAAVVAVLVLLLAVAVARTAWMADDAYVTLRTLDNLVHGRGLVYNPIERVQAYTHPLWMLLLAGPYALTGDAWRMPMAVGATVTFLAIGVLVAKVAWNRDGAVVALALLLASKAFVDWATSGLENPLEHLLLAAFAASLFRERPSAWALVLVVALLGTTRLDAILLVAPALAIVLGTSVRRGERWAVVRSVLGLVPLVAWHAFSLVYYGALLPNTAWAKLGTGLPASELCAQGLRYLAWNAQVDPPTLVGIGLGIAAGVRARDLRALGLVLGIALHLAYVVRIGGDFMAGRFLAAPLFVAALLVSRAPFGTSGALGLGGLLVGASLLVPHAPLRSGPGYARAKAEHGVVDERGYYWRGTGWWVPRDGAGPDHEFVQDGRAARGNPVAVKSVIGLYGYYAGPRHHVVDRLGLSDPLLARLPAEVDPDWRIGHFRRRIPDGYLASVRAPESRLADPEVRALDEAVRLAARGDLWTLERWRAIARLHLGTFPLDRERWVHGEVRWVEPGTGVEVGRRGAGVRLGGRTGTAHLALSAGEWLVRIERADRVLSEVVVEGAAAVPFDRADRLVAFPAERGTFSAALDGG